MVVGLLEVGSINANANVNSQTSTVLAGSADATGGVVTVANQSTNYADTNTTASGGGLIGFNGSTSTSQVSSSSQAAVGAGASVFGGSGVAVSASNTNTSNSTATGTTIGLVGVGTSTANSDIYSNTIAVTQDSTAGNPTNIGAGGGSVAFTASANNNENSNAVGTTGGAIAVGSAVANSLVENYQGTGGPNTHAGLGNDTIVSAPNAAFQISALTTADVVSNSSQAVVGVITSNQTQAYSVIGLVNSRNGDGSIASGVSASTLADTGSNVSINAGQVEFLAADTNLQASATGNASVPATFAGTNEADTYADMLTFANAHITGTTSIVTSGPATFYAGSPNNTDVYSTSSNPSTSTTGVVGSLVSNAESTKWITNQVNTDPGSTITANSVIAQALIPADGVGANAYAKNPVINNQTAGHYVAEAAGAVVKTVGTIVCAWGLLCNPSSVANSISNLGQSSTSPGSEILANTVNFNATVTIGGDNAPTLVVNSAGVVTTLSQLSATDGTNPLKQGDTVTTGEIVVQPIVQAAPGQVSILAPGGATNGHSTINFNLDVNVNITNASTANLFINTIKLFDSTNPPSVNTEAGSTAQNQWTYGPQPIGSLSAFASTVNIQNTNTNGGDVTILGVVDNPLGTTTIDSDGGSIFQASSSSTLYVLTRLINLFSAGSIATSSQSLELLLPVDGTAKDFSSGTPFPSGFESVMGTQGLWITVIPTVDNEFGTYNVSPLPFTVSNVSTGSGDMHLQINDGAVLEVTDSNVVNLSNGTTLNGTVLSPTFNPSTAVNLAQNSVNIGTTAGLTTGSLVIYNNGGGSNIPGLSSGRTYSVVPLSDNQSIELGNTFNPTAVNAAQGTITFANPIGFVTGDKVIYEAGSSGTIGNLVNGAVYYVKVIDSKTIKLVSNPSDVNDAPVTFLPDSYVNPADGTIHLDQPDGFSTGQAVTYTTTGTSISSQLANNSTYYVIVVDSSTIKLASSKTNAMNGVAIGLTNTATGQQSIGGLPFDLRPAVVSVSNEIFLPSASGFTNGQVVLYHTTGTPIGGLVNNTNYYVINVNSTTIQLAASAADAADGNYISLDPSVATGVQNVGGAFRLAQQFLRRDQFHSRSSFGRPGHIDQLPERGRFYDRRSPDVSGRPEPLVGDRRPDGKRYLLCRGDQFEHDRACRFLCQRHRLDARRHRADPQLCVGFQQCRFRGDGRIAWHGGWDADSCHAALGPVAKPDRAVLRDWVHLRANRNRRCRGPQRSSRQLWR